MKCKNCGKPIHKLTEKDPGGQMLDGIFLGEWIHDPGGFWCFGWQRDEEAEPEEEK